MKNILLIFFIEAKEIPFSPVLTLSLLPEVTLLGKSNSCILLHFLQYNTSILRHCCRKFTGHIIMLPSANTSRRSLPPSVGDLRAVLNKNSCYLPIRACSSVWNHLSSSSSRSPSYFSSSPLYSSMPLNFVSSQMSSGHDSASPATGC